MQRARAAGLTVLHTVSGWMLVGGLLNGLDALGLPPPKMASGGGMAGAGAAIVILFMFAVACLLALVGAVVMAVVLERRNPAAWRHAALAAALAIFLPGLLLFFDGPHASVVLSLFIPTGLLAVGSRFDVKRPALVGLALPALVLLGLVVAALKETADDAVRSRDSDRVSAIREAAEGHDAGALQASLDALPAVGAPDLDSELAYLPSRGDYRAELEQILKHPRTPQTPCTRLLRAALDGTEGVWIGLPAYSQCGITAATLAAHHDHPEELRKATHVIDTLDDRVRVLVQLAAGKDAAAALRWMNAAGLADERGRLAGRAMTTSFLSDTWSQDRTFLWEHADLDALLVATAANGAYEDRLREVMHHGGRANARLACGATPLTALITGHDLRSDSIAELLDGGADPNLPGARFCLDGDGGVLETPLWHLVERRHDWNNLPSSAIYLLVKRGADARRRGADGGTLVNEAEGDKNVLQALGGIDPYGASDEPQ